MAKKIVYSKGFDGVSDFVYVDLLPDVKRSRQFNMNVIIALTFGVVLSFAFIYMPFRAATEDFEDLNGLNNDLRHELLLTNEEFVGYEINLDTIAFEDQIELLKTNKVDYNLLFDQLKSLIELRNISYTTELTHVKYNGVTNVFEIIIESTQREVYEYLNNDFKNLDWVDESTKTSAISLQDGNTWRVTFTIGVDINAE